MSELVPVLTCQRQKYTLCFGPGIKSLSSLHNHQEKGTTLKANHQQFSLTFLLRLREEKES